jgi:plastocyanin
VDPGTGQPGAPRRAGSAWWWLVAVATVVTLASSAFAIATAVTSEDNGGSAASSSGCAAGTSAQARISDFAFQPAALTVTVGSCVTWTNEDNTTHTVTGTDTDLISSPDLDQGDTYSVTFDQAGTYHYICSIHTNMTGTVTVTG